MSLNTEIRADRYIAAIWRAVAKTIVDPRLVEKQRRDAVAAAEIVEAQLRLTAKLYAEEIPV